jgi:hypothetical protein
MRGGAEQRAAGKTTNEGGRSPSSARICGGGSGESRDRDRRRRRHCDEAPPLIHRHECHSYFILLTFNARQGAFPQKREHETQSVEQTTFQVLSRFIRHSI